MFAKFHDICVRKYTIFNKNRTAELHSLFMNYVGIPEDINETKYSAKFRGCTPFSGTKNERDIQGGCKDSSIMHGIIRYEYKTNLIEEGRINNKAHGLRVTFVQTGDIWIRLNKNDNRIAQIVLASDYSIQSNPKPVDEGGLDFLKANLPLILACLEAKK